MSRPYNSIKSLLSDSKVNGLHGAGNSDRQISEAEVELSIEFPSSYRRFLCTRMASTYSGHDLTDEERFASMIIVESINDTIGSHDANEEDLSESYAIASLMRSISDAAKIREELTTVRIGNES